MKLSLYKQFSGLMKKANPTFQIKVIINFEIEIHAEDIEISTRNLYEEIVLLDIENINLDKVGIAPNKSKSGEIINWGSMLVTLMATGGVATTLINSIQSWLTRFEHRSITLEIDNDKLTITGVSSEEQTHLINTWINRHTKST